MGTAWAWEPSAAVWRVGLSKANLFFMPRPVSNKSSTTVLRVSWAVKLLLKHDPCHVGDLQDNWLTSDVKRSGWGACPVLYVKDETQAALIPLRPCYWPPSWEQKTLVLRRPWIWIYIKPSHADLSQAMSAVNLPWSRPSRTWPASKKAAGDISQLQPTRNQHPSPPQVDTQLISVQKTWEKDVFIMLCVQLSVLLWLLTESFIEA